MSTVISTKSERPDAKADPIDFEVAITKFIFTNYVKKLRNIALSIGTIFYFIFRAENEHENLKRITYGKRYDLPIDKIKGMLLL